MSSFFTVPASQRKRKKTGERNGLSRKRREVDGHEQQQGESSSYSNTRRVKSTERDESISGSDSELEDQPESGEESEATSVEGETAADRRVRLAQRYLDNLREEVNEVGFDAEDVDKDLIAQRLKEDADEVKGRQFRLIASSLDFASARHASFRTDTLSTTAVAVCPPNAYMVSKDKTLSKWELAAPQDIHMNGDSDKKPLLQRRNPRKLHFVRGVKIDASATQQHGHTGPILSLAASPNGDYVVTGGADKRMIIWSTKELKPLKTFLSHRDAVTGLSFAPVSSQPGVGAQLFSGSMDRTLKTYSLNGDDSLAYVETLFGHQDHVTAVAAMGTDQCVSVGARDRTARLWKVVDETQLVFRADGSKKDPHATGSVDCVAVIPPAHFVTGTDCGSLQLWSAHKKKPLFVVQIAHGEDEPIPMEDVTSEVDPEVIAQLRKDDTRKPLGRAITALATIPGTDIILSGSWDGWIRAWKVSDDKRTLLSQGVVGRHDEAVAADTLTNTAGVQENGHTADTHKNQGLVTGFVNSLAVFERRKIVRNEFGGTKEGECQGICIVAGTGKEMRLGRWRTIPEGRNGGMVFEVPLLRAE